MTPSANILRAAATLSEREAKCINVIDVTIGIRFVIVPNNKIIFI